MIRDGNEMGYLHPQLIAGSWERRRLPSEAQHRQKLFWLYLGSENVQFSRGTAHYPLLPKTARFEKVAFGSPRSAVNCSIYSILATPLSIPVIIINIIMEIVHKVQ